MSQLILLVTLVSLHTRPLTHPCHVDKATVESSASALQEQNNPVSACVAKLEVYKSLRKDFEKERENEYKEKYLSLLEHTR